MSSTKTRIEKAALLIVMVYSLIQTALWVSRTNLWSDPRNIVQANVLYYSSIAVGSFLSLRKGKLRYLLYFFVLGFILHLLVFKIQSGVTVP